MKCFITTWAATLALAIVTAPALAMPADNGPATPSGADPVQPTRVALEHGTATIVYVLIALGAVLTLTACAYAGVRVLAQLRTHPGAG